MSYSRFKSYVSKAGLGGITGASLGISGVRCGPIGLISTTNAALTANLLYTHPILISRKGVYTKLSFRVTTLAAGANARIGLYSDLDGQPFMLLEDSGNISVASTGLKEHTMTRYLSPGLVWPAMVTDGTPQVNCVNLVSGMGCDSASSTSGPVRGYDKSFTFGALPSSLLGSTWTKRTGTSQPAMLLGFS